MEPLLIYGAKALVLPPGGNLLAAAAGGLAARRWPRFGRALVLAALVTLWLLALPAMARALADLIEPAVALQPEAAALRGAGAIVVLGGGRDAAAPEYGGDTVSARTLQRLRYAAHLQRVTGLPLAVTGGSVFGSGPPEAVLMRRVLEDELDVPVRWSETASRNTAENAAATADLLAAAGIRRIVLVTHALHLRRAAWAFEARGVDVVPAPTGFASVPPAARGPLDWLPSAGALALSRDALHEVLGLWWYRLRYGTG